MVLGEICQEPWPNTLNWAAYFGGTDNPDEDNYENGVLITSKPTSPISIPDEANP